MSYRRRNPTLQRVLTILWIACTAIWAAILYATITGEFQCLNCQ